MASIRKRGESYLIVVSMGYDYTGKRDAIAVYGQEANPDTWKMAKINLAIRGIDADLGDHAL